MFSSGESTSSDLATHENPRRPQFGLAALFWTIGVVGLTLAYLRQFESPNVYLKLFAVTVVACLIGATVGWWPRRMGDGIYWAIVITTAAYLSVIVEPRAGQTFQFAWAIVGAATGACCGTIEPNRLFRRMLVGCAAGTAVMLVFVQFGSMREGLFDLLCAPIVGALVGLLIELILWVEFKSSLARYITACWLLLAVMAGNLLVPLVRS